MPTLNDGVRGRYVPCLDPAHGGAFSFEARHERLHCEEPFEIKKDFRGLDYAVHKKPTNVNKKDLGLRKPLPALPQNSKEKPFELMLPVLDSAARSVPSPSSANFSSAHKTVDLRTPDRITCDPTAKKSTTTNNHKSSWRPGNTIAHPAPKLTHPSSKRSWRQRATFESRERKPIAEYPIFSKSVMEDGWADAGAEFEDAKVEEGWVKV